MVRRKYIHQRDDWPRFRWDEPKLATLLGDVRHRQGRLIGRMESFGFELRAEASVQSLTEEIVKSSAIEGEALDAEQVRSSLARRLGLEAAGVTPAERAVEGVVEMMIDATQRYAEPLNAERLFDWHGALFPTGRSGLVRVRVADWRDDSGGPMQVVSGPIGRERVHYEAPDAPRVPGEMAAFLAWAEDPQVNLDPVLKAGLAHLWFVTIHPFDDGNGRIARAIGELMLARSENSAQRFYSMSAQICAERRVYYDLLESVQKGSLDVTEWLGWFLECLGRAFDRAEATLEAVARRAAYWQLIRTEPLNERQKKVINRLLDGFEGKLTSSKWAALTKSSQDTAARDIQELVERGLLKRGPGGGRSTHYLIADADGDSGT